MVAHRMPSAICGLNLPIILFPSDETAGGGLYAAGGLGAKGYC